MDWVRSIIDFRDSFIVKVKKCNINSVFVAFRSEIMSILQKYNYYEILAEGRSQKVSAQLRCSRCGAFLYKKSQIHKCRLIPLQDITRPKCPRCNSGNTIKSGLNVWAVQIWRCLDCTRCFREVIIKRTDYYERVSKSNIVESEGRCLRCGKSDYLGDGLCVECFDTLSYRQSLYYRKLSLGLCVRCGKPKDNNKRLCAYCSEKVRYWRIKEKMNNEKVRI